MIGIGLWIIAVAVGRTMVQGCTTKGIMPLRDRGYNPFCCDPTLGNAHCPAGARCEPDMYYGYGFICCGSIQMVWDAYGGGYKKAEYSGCGKPKAAPAATMAPRSMGSMAQTAISAAAGRLAVTSAAAPPAGDPGAPGRHPRGDRGPVAEGTEATDYEQIPANWTVDTDSPQVIPIIVGDYQESALDADAMKGWKGRGSVTLVRDGSCTIVVDTGSATDEETIINGLASFGLHPLNVQYVVVTQGTPEHMGNQNLFTKSKIFYAWIMIDWDHFITTDLGKTDFVRLCPRTELHLTPGVTKDAITLLVRNVTKYGTVAIVGDLFLYEHAHDFIPKQFAGFVWDVQALLQSREKILCQADVVFPGHGPKFLTQRINSLADSRLNCTSSASVSQPRRKRRVNTIRGVRFS